jgi:inorganic pyrophosphatase
MRHFETRLSFTGLLFVVSLGVSCGDPFSDRARMMAGGAPVTSDARSPDAEHVVGSRHFVDGYPALNSDGSVNVVIEIPAGTTAKFEVDKASGVLQWERTNGALRTIEFLGYPGNYGMVPSTLLPVDECGDGDPLDALVLGSAIERGSLVRVRLIGVLRLLDEGEIDDKLIAVPAQIEPGNPFSSLEDISELAARHPEAKRIIELWFSAYEGAGIIEVKGWSDSEEAKALLLAAQSSYREGR